MTTLILIRHGESETNKDRIFTGQMDVALSERGVLQAERAAEWVLEHYSVDALYASDLKRTVQTAKPLSERTGLPVRTDARLREIYAGIWQGQHFDDLEAKYGEMYRQWCEDIGRSRCADGENCAELHARVLAALTEIARENEGRTVAVATHATPVRTMQCMCMGLPIERLSEIAWVPNASASVFRYENGEFSLVEAGISSYLDESMLTRLPKNC